MADRTTEELAEDYAGMGATTNAITAGKGYTAS